MKQNMRDRKGCPTKLVTCVTESAGGNPKTCARPNQARIALCLLAFSLMALAIFVPLAIVSNASAQSACLILCPPTPTPRPDPSPSATSRPEPSPTTRPRPSPTATATAKPTAQASASPEPTVVITEVKQTPVVASSGHISPSRQNSSTPPAQGVLLISAVAVAVIFALFLTLLSGWLLIRRSLVPPAARKLPPSGARPWSRFYVPSPASLLPLNNELRAPEQKTTSPGINTVPGDFQETTLISTASGGTAPDPWQPVSGDKSDNPGNFKRKKRGLITKAFYYADLATNNDEKTNLS